VRRLAALLAAGTALAGCSAATSNGFTAEPPSGWTDETDTAETRTGSEFEAVYEGTSVEGVEPVLTVTRVKASKARTLDAATAAARIAVDRRFEEADPTAVTPTELGGERALRFDYRTGEKKARYVTARHGGHLYAVTLQSAATGFDRALVVLDEYLSGWRWDA
jgi:ABC-type glycerol-3-phosphate transport system substrate-binding protein